MNVKIVVKSQLSILWMHILEFPALQQAFGLLCYV